eukprot:TRINITY_DN6313_c0_g1_i4.p1 TRINITY_DN6313_c0_g1~~TRINITY_DN6313_c0_g1_i4.p1  ORF type:complete len:403 (+),score=66.53 TRINITY_DN6313_c0_g1_i4:75-1283(+)
MDRVTLPSIVSRITESASCFFSACLSLGQSTRAAKKNAAAAVADGSLDETSCPRKICRVDGGPSAGECSSVEERATASASIEDCTKPLLFIFDLPDVVDGIGNACCDPCLLSCLGMATKHLWSLISSPGFATRRASELSAQGLEEASGCRSLEHLAIALKVAKMCGTRTKNHVYFPYGAGLEVQPRTRHLLTNAAKLCRRHPCIKLHVDAHAGAGAPSGAIAMDISKRRADAVIQELLTRGLQGSRLGRTGWGKKVTTRWSEPEDDTAARAELYVRVLDLEFPRRPDYYSLVPEGRRPPPPGEAAANSDASSDEELGAARRRVVGIRLRSGQLISLAQMMALMQDDDGDDDDDDDMAGAGNDDDGGVRDDTVDNDTSSSSSDTSGAGSDSELVELTSHEHAR